MDQQKMDAKKQFKTLPFGKKIEHIWFYYKWWIIVPVLVLLLVGYTVYDAKTRPEYDLEGTFYSEVYVSEEQIAGLEEFLSQFVEDRNGDGEKNIKLHSASVGMMDNEAEGSMAINMKFSTEMAAGADPFLLVDSAFYEVLNQDAYALAIETPQELTAIPAIRDIFNTPDDVKVYWVTRALYQDEKDDEEAIQMHDITAQTEENIFGSRK